MSASSEKPRLVTTRKLHDMKVQRLAERNKRNPDIARFLPVVVLSVCCVSIIVTIKIQNPTFLTSQSGYVNAVSINQHFLEAKYLKDFLQNGTSNFWFPDNSLGYPMYVTLQPLPGFVTALAFILFERFATPLCIFRWMMVVLVAIIPVTWYKGMRRAGVSRAEGLMIGLLFLATSSQQRNGFEINAYFKEGLLPQLFAQCLFPLAVSSIYNSVSSKRHDGKCVYFLCLVYLCSAFTGVFCSMISFITHLLFGVINGRSFKEFQQFFVLHLKVTAYLLWLIIPCLISYPYIGGGVMDRHGSLSLTDIVDIFNNGLLFDWKRRLPWLTVLVSFGIVLSVRSIIDSTAGAFDDKKSASQQKRKLVHSWWLVLVTMVSCFFYMKNPLVDTFMSLMPFALDFDNKSFIIGLHFCGVLMAGKALCWIAGLLHHFDILSFDKKGTSKNVVVFIVSMALIMGGTERINRPLSTLEMSEEFFETLNKIKHASGNKGGRILAHSKLGTGGSWDMSHIPALTGRPGAVSYSTGWHDSLSSFYINSIPFGEVGMEDLKPLFRLYNIQYVVASSGCVDEGFHLSPFLRNLHTVDDLTFYEVDFEVDYFEEPLQSYFDFVRLPGYIDGKLRSVRETVLESLSLYTVNTLFYLNPRQSSQVRQKGMINAQVMDVSSQKTRLPHKGGVSLVTWKLNKQGMSSEDVFKHVEMQYEEVDVQSKVIEERWTGLEYHAVVEVVADSEFVNLEHLLLKVSYHPFWRCVYFPVNETYTLGNDDSQFKVIPRNRSSVSVDHVTPNLISVSLPTGRYHVVFRYRTPGILKLMFIVSTLIFLNNSLRLSLFFRIAKVIAVVWDRIEMYQMRLLFKSIHIMNTLYYRSLGIDFKLTFRRLSTVDLGAAQNNKRKKITGWISNKVESYKQSFVALSARNTVSSDDTPLQPICTKSEGEPPIGLDDPFLKTLQEKHVKISLTSDDINKKDDKSSIDAHSSDHDSFCSDFVMFRSPPTPPKHTKKSYRKRSARNSTGDEALKKPQISREEPKQPVYQQMKECITPSPSVDVLFQTASTRKSTSPVLGSILESLRKNSMSSRKDSTSSRIEKFSPRRLSRINSTPEKSSPRMDTLVSCHSLSSIGDETSSLTDSIDNNNRKQTLVPSSDKELSLSPEERKDTLLPADRDTSFGSSGGEWDDLLFDSYSSSNSKDDVIEKNTEIDVNRLVSSIQDDKEDDGKSKPDEDLDSLELSLEDSFSPRSSSSPEISLSPERFSGSPDGHSSPDNSFEYTAYSNCKKNEEAAAEKQETAMKSDIYRIYLPDSPKEERNASSRRHTVYDPVNEEISRLQRLSPGNRRVTISATTSELHDDYK